MTGHGDKIQNLLEAVKEAVCLDYKKLEGFCGVLCKFHSTYPVQKTMYMEYKEVYPNTVPDCIGGQSCI